jgi:hypothetical protein
MRRACSAALERRKVVHQHGFGLDALGQQAFAEPQPGQGVTAQGGHDLVGKEIGAAHDAVHRDGLFGLGLGRRQQHAHARHGDRQDLADQEARAHAFALLHRRDRALAGLEVGPESRQPAELVALARLQHGIGRDLGALRAQAPEGIGIASKALAVTLPAQPVWVSTCQLAPAGQRQPHGLARRGLVTGLQHHVPETLVVQRHDRAAAEQRRHFQPRAAGRQAAGR